MRVVCISDTHGKHEELVIPDGDMFIHCGDFTQLGRVHEISAFNYWLASLKHTHKIIIAGNHEKLFETNNRLARSLITNATYLENSGVEIEGRRLWGSPVTPYFFNWAFNISRGEMIQRVWNDIPDNLDVLITHGPPHTILDTVKGGAVVGCEELLRKVKGLNIKRHVFGHIHEGYGHTKRYGTEFMNASSLDHKYQVINKPWVFDI